MTDRYVFLRTAHRQDEVVALIGDRDILGDSGIKDLRNAFNAHATPIMRAGVLSMTETQLKERLTALSQQGDMPQSVAAFNQALSRVQIVKGNNSTMTAGAPKRQPLSI